MHAQHPAPTNPFASPQHPTSTADLEAQDVSYIAPKPATKWWSKCTLILSVVALTDILVLGVVVLYPNAVEWAALRDLKIEVGSTEVAVEVLKGKVGI